jgi:hypothetical protein
MKNKKMRAESTAKKSVREGKGRWESEGTK